MKEKYILKSRYGSNHELIRWKDDLYEYSPAETWMMLRIVYKDNKQKELVAIDTDGGPMLSSGWHNDEIMITEMVAPYYVRLKEIERPKESINEEPKKGL